MLAILNSSNAHYFHIFQPILMILVSKFMVHRALSDKTYLSLGLLSTLKLIQLLPKSPKIKPILPKMYFPFHRIKFTYFKTMKLYTSG